VIPASVAAAIKAKHPTVILYEHDGHYAHGFAVELDGKRSGWHLEDTPHAWERVKDAALAWLADIAGAH
jgi:dienelactone hydrolase